MTFRRWKAWFGTAKNQAERPTLIILKSVIAKGSVTMAGSHKAHGAPLGQEEVRATRKALGVPEDAEFFVPAEARSYLAGRARVWEESYRRWREAFNLWAKENPEKHAEWTSCQQPVSPKDLVIPSFKKGDMVATRLR